MGDLKRKCELEKLYVKGDMKRDQLFGEYYVYNSFETNSKIICVEKLFNDKETVLRELEAKKKKIFNRHDNFLNVLDYSLEEQKNWCSTFYLLKTFYEYSEKTLKREIIDRKNSESSVGSFSAKEMTYLLYQMVSANAHLQERQQYHGDISPSTIYVDTSGNFRLAFRCNEQMTAERAQIDKSFRGEPLYLSPTLYAGVRERNLEKARHNPQKSDIFALGLTLLEAGLLKSVQGIYEGRSTVDSKALEELIQEFELQHDDNPLMYSTVRKMLEIEEDERPDFPQLLGALPDFKEIQDYFYKLENNLLEDEQDEYQSEHDFEPLEQPDPNDPDAFRNAQDLL
jgi:serine/threonine protein kinase